MLNCLLTNGCPFSVLKGFKWVEWVKQVENSSNVYFLWIQHSNSFFQWWDYYCYDIALYNHNSTLVLKIK